MEKELLKKWILYAQADLSAARRIFESPKPTSWDYLIILWHCQQAIEKTLKMLALKKNKELLKIHDLPRLLKQAAIDNISKEQVDFIFNLNSFYLRSRYPDMNYAPFSKLDKKFTKDYLIKTRKLFLWLKKQ